MERFVGSREPVDIYPFNNKKLDTSAGGEGGIRTPGTLPVNGFQPSKTSINFIDLRRNYLKQLSFDKLRFNAFHRFSATDYDTLKVWKTRISTRQTTWDYVASNGMGVRNP
jgi:hypothetical protein